MFDFSWSPIVYPPVDLQMLAMVTRLRTELKSLQDQLDAISIPTTYDPVYAFAYRTTNTTVSLSGTSGYYAYGGQLTLSRHFPNGEFDVSVSAGRMSYVGTESLNVDVWFDFFFALTTGSAGDDIYIWIYKNGASYAPEAMVITAANLNDFYHCHMQINMDLTEDDYVEIRFRDATTGSAQVTVYSMNVGIRGIVIPT